MSAAAKRRVLVGVAISAAMATLPAAAAAKPRQVLEFRLKGSGGYAISVKAVSGGPNASVQVERAPSHSSKGVALTTYIARARVSTRRITAQFPGLGRIEVRFDPSGRVLHGIPQGNCRGPDRITTRPGTFRGLIEFRGEGGYTSVSAHQAAGSAASPPALHCLGALTPGSGQPPRSEPKLTTVDAIARRGLLATAFEAQSSGTQKALYLATSEETRGQLAISRIAIAPGPAGTFATDSALTFASVSPPPPFTGTGTLARNADGSRIWAGSLAVNFPGAENVPLTGPQFRTRLIRSW